MKSFSIFTTVLVFAYCLGAIAEKETVLATVGDRKILLDDFNKKFNDVVNHSVNPPTKKQFLEDLIRFEVGSLEADKKNLAKDPIVIERIKQETYKVLIEKELGKKVQGLTVSDKEMAEYYKQNPEIRTSHILFEVKAGATEEQRAEAKGRADKILVEVKASKRPFEELVRLYSDDPLSKQTGGDVGWQNRLTLVPNYYDAIVKLKVGEVTGLIETQYGFHIVKVSNRRTFENSDKRALRTAVFDEKRKQAFNDYFEKLKKNYKISSNPKLLE